MRKNTVLAFGAALALPLAACGSDGTGGGPNGGSDDVEEDDAEEAFDATWNTADKGADEAQQEAGFWPGTASAAPADFDQDMSFEIDCPGGGSASFDGDIEGGAEADGQEMEIEFDLGYDACEEDGVVIDGDVTYFQYFAQSEESMEMSVLMDGVLDYDGEVQGTCEMDLEVQVTMEFPSLDDDFDNGGFEFDIEVEKSGTFCGYTLDELEADALDEENFEDEVDQDFP